LEVVLETGPASQTIVALSTIVEQYLRDLRDTLGNDTDRARVLLAKMVGTVTLRRQGEDLIGEVRGNLRGLLHMEDEERFGSDGAGRPALQLPTRVYRISLPHSSSRHGRGSSETS
jgi:hypothetical protein